ncbi:GTPase domain-containing protein [Cellulomonas sp. PS-H5]|uniref:dynamin family protein n=1 Tax=Cellulomonas sp. PS-H5 TaxID=2820400 RepID=UPI001C4E3EC8|nr:GTPase domain-containing protein [Cellulomonas sp. PS-H5]MBW0253639.1 GTPase domain-containing protein [Cellulomonas sp. PS-H5]
MADDTPPPAAGAVTGADAALADALDRLRARLRDLALPLDAPGAAQARGDRRAALDQLDDYLLPRLRSAGAPLLVVVGGSTGAGKSTLVNSLLGERVSDPGVLRPTTRSPVLVHHPLDAGWFAGDRVLPGLARLAGDRGPSTGAGADAEPGAAAVRLAPSPALPRGLALLDAPDVDSVEEANRRLAAQLLAAADLWLFVTTAARYADAVPWDLLHTAAERHAQVALVVDRVDPGSEAAVEDLRRMLDANGLSAAPLFVVAEGVGPDGLLPEDAVGPVAAWLSDLGGDAAARRAVAVATRDGVVDDLAGRGLALARAADEQVVAAARLRDAVERAYAEAAAQVGAATSDGAMLRGEVLARWQELVGTGDLLRSVERGVGRVRDAVVGFLRGRPAAPAPVEQAIAHGLAAVVLDAADAAAERTHAAWRGDPSGAGLLPDLGLSRSSATLRADVDREIRAWQADVLALVGEQGAQRRGTARALSFGVNALGVSLMVLAFASTGGLTGVEVGIAGGTAVVAQKLLEAVFGDDAVRRLTAEARERLDARVRGLLAGEAARYTAQLDALVLTGGEPLRSAATAVADAARAERAGRGAEKTGVGRASAEGADAREAVAGHAGAGGQGASRAGADALPAAAGDAPAPAGTTTSLRGADRWRAVSGQIGPGRAPGAGGGTWSAATASAGAGGRSGAGVADGGSTHGDADGDDRPRGGFWRRLLGREDRG